MPNEAQMKVIVLWEHEVRTAAKACAAAVAAGDRVENDKSDAAKEAFSLAMIHALNACLGALAGAEEDGNALTLSRMPPIGKRRLPKRGFKAGEPTPPGAGKEPQP